MWLVSKCFSSLKVFCFFVFANHEYKENTNFQDVNAVRSFWLFLTVLDKRHFFHHLHCPNPQRRFLPRRKRPYTTFGVVIPKRWLGSLCVVKDFFQNLFCEKNNKNPLSSPANSANILKVFPWCCSRVFIDSGKFFFLPESFLRKIKYKPPFKHRTRRLWYCGWGFMCSWELFSRIFSAKESKKKKKENPWARRKYQGCGWGFFFCCNWDFSRILSAKKKILQAPRARRTNRE